MNDFVLLCEHKENSENCIKILNKIEEKLILIEDKQKEMLDKYLKQEQENKNIMQLLIDIKKHIEKVEILNQSNINTMIQRFFNANIRQRGIMNFVSSEKLSGLDRLD